VKVLALIPARMGSSRFPGKPLAPLLGKPMIGHVYERVSRNTLLALTAVATCDRARVDLVSIDAEGARWRVSGIPRHGKGAAALADAVAQAIEERKMDLGRAGRRASAP